VPSAAPPWARPPADCRDRAKLGRAERRGTARQRTPLHESPQRRTIPLTIRDAPGRRAGRSDPQEDIAMHTLTRIRRSMLPALAAGAAFALLAPAGAQEMKLTLKGSDEVPAVTTSAAGSGTITVGSDKSVSGSVTTTGVAGTMAHIHEGAAGANGPVIIPLTKEGSDKWVVPSGSKLTDAQYESFKAGKLYVNVHSAAHPGGEGRAQLKP